MNMRTAATATALFLSFQASYACDHTIFADNWKSCAVGDLTNDGGDGDWAAVPKWTRKPSISYFFGNEPRLLANHGLCNEKFHRVVLCLVGWEDGDDKNSCEYKICEAFFESRRK
jgi:hypothetical protein